jgi:hypothetical protein
MADFTQALGTHVLLYLQHGTGVLAPLDAAMGGMVHGAWCMGKGVLVLVVLVLRF